jgi:DNA-binding XRE family transcriptional regulator
MERFEMYLTKKHKFISDMISILSINKDSAIQIEIEKLQAELDLLDDIIHHFTIFVKEAENV